MQQTPYRVCVIYRLACLTSIAFLPVLFGADAAVSLQTQSVSHTQKIHLCWVTQWGVLCHDPLHRTLKSFRTCANLKCMCTFVSVRSNKIFSIYGHTQTDRHTHASRNAVTLVWGSLRLAPIYSLENKLFSSTSCCLLLLVSEPGPWKIEKEGLVNG